MFYAGLRAFAKAYIEGKDVPEILDVAGRAILRIQRSLVLLFRIGAEERDRAFVLWFTGWIHTHISLEHNPRLRKMLEHEGKHPYAVLLERLPAVVAIALAECEGKTLAELLSQSRYLVEHDGLALEPQDHFSEEESLPKMSRAIAAWDSLSTALEDWRTREQARGDINRLCAKAGLSRRMTEALLLKSEGYARKEIAARMGISDEMVKEHLST